MVTATSSATTTASLLEPPDTVAGAVDYKGRPISRSTSGGWRSASFIIGVEMAERFAYYGIGSNLISYLTGPMGQATAEAAEVVNVWIGVGSMLPLLGAFVADSYLGRFRMILLATLLYILGLGLLTLSAVLPSLRPPPCTHSTYCPSPSPFQVFFFFASLYLVALAQGGHKPCVQAFGADQFDPSDPKETKDKCSFFNWWYFSIYGGNLVLFWILTYIQDNVSWGLGFGIPCISLVISLLVFLLGIKTYRHTSMEDTSPFVRIGRVIAYLVRQRIWQKAPVSSIKPQLKFLGAEVAVSYVVTDKRDWNMCTESEVEEAKAILQLIPIWLTCLIYAVVFAQSSTFFTKQGSTMDRRIWSDVLLSPANLQSFISVSILIFIPIYDRVLVPTMRAITGISSGITMLQRIGIGMLVSIISMVLAAITEVWRLRIAKDSGLLDKPGVTVPMSIWWLIPQYMLFGIADVFTMVGLQEFFYDQVPEGLRSVGLSLYLSIFGIGSFLSSFLISVIDKVTGAHGDSWFATNLNRAHLDYFYWLLAGLSTLALGLYVYFSRSYIYRVRSPSSTIY